MEGEAVSRLCISAQIIRMAKDSVLFEESEPAGSFYSVLSGTIRVYTASKSGRELVIETLSAGQCICCAPLYGTTRHCVSARTIEDSVLTVLPAEKLRSLVFSNASEAGQAVVSCLSSRFERLIALLNDLAFRDVEERVITVLYRLVRQSRAGERGTAFLSVTHHDIAAMAGTVREVASRTMSKLKKDRVITTSTVRGFAIDIEKLADFLKK